MADIPSLSQARSPPPPSPPRLEETATTTQQHNNRQILIPTVRLPSSSEDSLLVGINDPRPSELGGQCLIVRPGAAVKLLAVCVEKNTLDTPQPIIASTPHACGSIMPAASTPGAKRREKVSHCLHFPLFQVPFVLTSIREKSKTHPRAPHVVDRKSVV